MVDLLICGHEKVHVALQRRLALIRAAACLEVVLANALTHCFWCGVGGTYGVQYVRQSDASYQAQAGRWLLTLSPCSRLLDWG